LSRRLIAASALARAALTGIADNTFAQSAKSIFGLRLGWFFGRVFFRARKQAVARDGILVQLAYVEREANSDYYSGFLFAILSPNNGFWLQSGPAW